MKVYILQEYGAAGCQNWEYDKMIWGDINALHAYISVLQDVETIDVRPNACNSWDVFDVHGQKAFHIIETKLNPTYRLEPRDIAAVRPRDLTYPCYG